MLYAFGGNTNETPETIKQKREIARALLAARAPQTVGDGLNSIGDGIVAAVLNSRANDAEKAGQESASLDFAPFYSPNNFADGQTAPPSSSVSSGNTTPNSVIKTDLPPIGSMESARTQDRASIPNYSALGNGENDVAGYIRQAALSRGIDPNVALKVAGHEGLNGFDPTKPDPGGDGGSSFGPMQLHYAGLNPKMPNAGLGDEFTKATGLDARDPSTWKDQVNFALNYAAKNGWSPWMGAKAEGITGKMGIGTPGTEVAYAPQAQPNDAVSAIDAQMAPKPPADIPWLQYDNANAIRSKPLNSDLTKALSFIPDMGLTMKVFSGGQDESGPNRTGSHRHDDGGAGDVFFYKDGRQLDWNNPKDLPIFQEIVRRGKDAGITGFGAGPGYMQPGSMHIGFGAPAVWGAGGRSANAPDWLRQAYNGSPNAVADALAKTAYAPQSGNVPAVDAINSIAPQSGPSPVVKALANTQGSPSASVTPPAGVQVAQNAVGAPVASDAGNQSAVVRALAGQSSNVKPGYFPAAPNQPGQAGLSRAQIIRVLSNPFATDEQKMIAKDAYDRIQKQNDPGAQLDMEIKRAQLKALEAKPDQVPESVRALRLRAQEAGLVPGTKAYSDFMVTGGGKGTTVNVDNGTIPAGYRAVRDPEGRIMSIEPIPGSPAASDAAAAAQKQNKAADSALSASDIITTAAGRARDAAKHVLIPSLTSTVGAAPWTDSAEVMRQIGVLKSNATIGSLNAMRAASPTGGALGNVTEKEGAMLAAQAGALDPNSPNFQRDLDDYERSLLRTIHGKEAGDQIFDQTRGGTTKPKFGGSSNEPPKPQSQAEFDALPSGTIYIDPDDNKQYRKP